MGMFDKLKGKAADAVDQHGDKIADGLDKAGDFADRKTGGKHTEQIDSAVKQAGDRLDALDGKNDDIPDVDRGAAGGSGARGQSERGQSERGPSEHGSSEHGPSEHGPSEHGPNERGHP